MTERIKAILDVVTAKVLDHRPPPSPPALDGVSSND